MADEQSDIPEMDYAEHNSTYAGFVDVTKYTVIAIAIIAILLILMAIFL